MINRDFFFQPLGPLGVGGGGWGGWEHGRFVHFYVGRFIIFTFSLVFWYLRVPKYPDAKTNSTESVVVTPPFACSKAGEN